MSLSRLLCAAVVTVLVTAACSDPSATALGRTDGEVPADLTLLFPSFTDADRMRVEHREITPSEAPAAALQMEDPDESPPEREAMSSIWSERTEVGFQGAYAYSRARHSYSGNVGRVETVATVYYGSQVVGTQPKAAQDYIPFLFDFGMNKSITTEAYVFIDQECGLRVDGTSSHLAWWEWSLVDKVSTWGRSERNSQAFPPVEQPSCQQDDILAGGFAGGSEGGGGSGSGAVTCWYWVTYDSYTGEIYDAEFLYCDDAMEGG